MVFGRPVAQAIEHEIAHHRMVAVERVAAPAEVAVVTVRREQVVGLVVQPAEGNGRAPLVALRGVVEDHVEDHLNTLGMAGLDQVFEFVHLAPLHSARRIARLGCMESHRAVSPVVAKPFARVRIGMVVLVLVELENRHQLDAVDAERFEVGELFAQSVERSRVDDPRRCMPGEAADVQFVNDQLFDRQIERPVVFPIEVVLRNASAVRENIAAAHRGAERLASADGAGERVEQDDAAVEAVPGLGVARAVHTETVFDGMGVEVVDGHGIHIANAEFRRERNLGEGSLCAHFEEDQRAVGRVRGKNGEIDSSGHDGSPERKRVPVTQAEHAVMVCGFVPATVSCRFRRRR